MTTRKEKDRRKSLAIAKAKQKRLDEKEEENFYSKVSQLNAVLACEKLKELTTVKKNRKERRKENKKG